MTMTEKMRKSLGGRVETATAVALLAVLMVAGLFASSAFAAVPTDISLSPSKVMSTVDTTLGTVIGSLSTTDADGGDTFTYSIVAGGADNAVFAIVGGNDLQLTDGVIDIALPTDANADGVYEVRVRTTDGTANTFDKTLQVNIVPVYIPLVHSSLSTDSSKWSASNGWGITGGKYGQFTCGTCHAASTGNIKRVKTTLIAPNGTDQFPIEADPTPPVGGVNLQDVREGSSDFANDARADKSQSSNICEACHTYDPTQTNGVKYHGYDMTVGGDPLHYNMAACMVCHPHKQGFKPQACDSCHGYPPTDVSPGGPTGLADNPFSTASATAGAHTKHAITLGLACTNCHDGYSMPQESSAKSNFGDISISFNNFGVTTGSYDGQSNVSYNDVLGSGAEACSNVYCHSTGQSADGTSATPSAYASPSWSTPGSGACDTCHDETDMATGSHTQHINDGATCDTCHVGNNHVDHVIDVTTSTYNAAGAPGNGYGDCSNATCHDDGTGSPAPTPTWGVTVSDCSECHANVPDSGGSHQEHVVSTTYAKAVCADCHKDAVQGASAATGGLHIDGNVDVYDTAGDDLGYPTLNAKGNGYESCDTSYCHSTGQSTSDGASAVPSYATVTWGGGAACGTCHKVTEATGLTSGSHAAHLGTAGVSGCADCHTGAANDASAYNNTTHVDGQIDVTNTYTAAGAPGNGYGECNNATCHDDGTGSPAPTLTWGVTVSDCSECHANVPDSGGSHQKHVVSTTYAKAACADCHKDAVQGASAATGDLHIDGNVDVYDTAGDDLGYPTLNAKGNGYESCDTSYCHSTGQSTSDGASAVPSYATVTWGGGAVCGTCHKVTEATGLTSGSHAAHLGTAGVSGCADCHTGAANDASAYNNTTHVDGQIDVTNTYTAAGAPGNGYGECNNASCHDDGTGNPATTPIWGVTVSDCSECHGNAPTTGAHTIHLEAATNGLIASLTCASCHNDAVQGTSAATGEHGVGGDGNLDIYGTTVNDFGYGTDVASTFPAYNTRTCNTSYCHGNNMPKGTTSGTTNAPTWSASSGGCGFCHDMPPDPATIGAHAGQGLTDCIDCHGAGKGSVNAAGDGFTNSGATHINGTVDGGGDSCTDCHSTLNGAHDAHTGEALILGTAKLSVEGYGGLANWYSISHVSGKPNFGCGLCHPKSAAAHNTGGSPDVNLAWDDTGAAGSLKANNGNGANYAGFGGACNQVYCHSDGEATAVRVYGWQSSANWSDGTISGNCNDCHGNSPTTNAHSLHAVGIHYDTLLDDDGAGLMATDPTGTGVSGGADAAHGNSATSDTIGCQTCHSDTVAVEYNSANSVCTACHAGATGSPAIGGEKVIIDSAGSTHVNGQPDVVFADLSTFKSKAQVRNDITTVTELNNSWARYDSGLPDNTAYKKAASYDQGKAADPYAAGTCSNIACHNGNTATWTDSNVSCMYCHTSLPQ